MSLISVFKGRSAVLFFPVLMWMTALNEPLVFVLVPGMVVLCFRWEKRLGLCCLVLFGLLTVVSVNRSVHLEGDVAVDGVVKRVEKARTHPRLLLRSDAGRLYVYHDTLDGIYPGDALRVTGLVSQPEPSGFFHGFDYAAYLKSVRIEGLMYEAEIVPLEPRENFYRINGAIERYLETNLSRSTPYIKAFLLADRTALDDGFYAQAQSLGIAHLFAVSGLHVAVLFFAVLKLVRVFVTYDVLAETIGLSGLMAYVVLTGAPPSVLRATLMATLLIVNRRLKLQWRPVDLLVWLMIALLLVHPAYFDHVGFVLSFTISYALLMSQALMKNRSRVEQLFLVSLIAFLFGLPYTSDIQQHINPISVLYNVGYVLFLTFVLLPLSYTVFILPVVEPIALPVFSGFEQSVDFLSTQGSLYVPLHVLPGVETILYFTVLFWVMAASGRKKWRLRAAVFALFLMVLIMKPSLRVYGRMTMFNVHGDAFLLEDRFNRCNFLIDTGEPDAHQQLLRALRARHIRKLDLVLISHKHFDHYGAYDEIAAAIAIDQTITNQSQQPFEGKWHQCGNIAYFIYPSTGSYGDENNRSMVVKIVFEDIKILFTGDIERETERDFIATYQPHVDLLKVAHHGSNTSSSSEFLAHVAPREAWISAHRNNRFNFPNPSVVARLEASNIAVVRLDETGTVSTTHFLNRRFKKTAFGP